MSRIDLKRYQHRQQQVVTHIQRLGTEARRFTREVKVLEKKLSELQVKREQTHKQILEPVPLSLKPSVALAKTQALMQRAQQQAAQTNLMSKTLGATRGELSVRQESLIIYFKQKESLMERAVLVRRITNAKKDSANSEEIAESFSASKVATLNAPQALLTTTAGEDLEKKGAAHAEVRQHRASLEEPLPYTEGNLIRLQSTRAPRATQQARLPIQPDNKAQNTSGGVLGLVQTATPRIQYPENSSDLSFCSDSRSGAGLVQENSYSDAARSATGPMGEITSNDASSSDADQMRRPSDFMAHIDSWTTTTTQGATQFSISLNAEGGRAVTLTLNRLDNGKIQASLRNRDPSDRRVLWKESRAIREALSKSGIQDYAFLVE